MALTYTTALNGQFGNKNARIVKIAHSNTGSETTATVVAGAQMMTPIGGYTDSVLTASTNTYVMTIADGAVSSYSNILFLGA